MAYRFGDSCDHTATADIGLKWSSVTSNVTISSGGGRNSSNAIAIAANTNNATKTLSSHATWVIEAAVKFNSITNAAGAFFAFLDSGTLQMDLRLTSSGELQVTRNGTQLGITSGLGLTASTYYHIGYKVTIDNSAGAYEVRVNGSNVLSGSSADTQNSANASANQVKITNSNSLSTTTFDDIVVCDGSGSINNTFLGDARQKLKMPNGAGNYSQWTPSAGSNYQNVDDTTPDGDTTFNSSSTAGQKDSFTFAALGITGTVSAVQVSFYVRKDDAGSRSVRPFVRIGSTDYYGSTVSVSSAYSFVQYIWETSPATAAAWTVSELDAAEFGYELVS